MIDMSWEDVIKNVRDTPMGDMEELTEGNIRATRIAAKMAVKQINELRDKIDNIVKACEDGIEEMLKFSRRFEDVDAEYVEKLLENIRKIAHGDEYPGNYLVRD